MRVTVNGERRETAAESVAALLRELEYEGTYFAVAVNHKVVPRQSWTEVSIRSGDRIEILTPRQGG